VAVTSHQCPSCKAELDLPPETWQKQAVNVFWLLLYAVIFFVLGLGLVVLLTKP
jgi:cytochrome b561